MTTIPKIVLQNPYRILGVYANSRRNEIVANKSRATAFLTVNRPVEYPLDLKGLLPAPNRTLDLMNEAEAHLAIAKEQVKSNAGKINFYENILILQKRNNKNSGCSRLRKNRFKRYTELFKAISIVTCSS